MLPPLLIGSAKGLTLARTKFFPTPH